jgi:hypothetical protein
MMSDKSSDNEKGPVALLTGPATIFVALTRLSLAGLHPCRAQLRFTEQLYYSSSFACSVRIDAGTYRADGRHVRNTHVCHHIEQTRMTGTETPPGLVHLIARLDGPIDPTAEMATPPPKTGKPSCAKLNRQKPADRAKTSQTRSPAPDAGDRPWAHDNARSNGVKVDANETLIIMGTVRKAHPFTCRF